MHDGRGLLQLRAVRSSGRLEHHHPEVRQREVADGLTALQRRALGTRRRWCSAVCVVSFVGATAAGACNQQTSSNVDLTRAGSCPYRTEAEWQVFLEGAARSDVWEKTCDDDGC